MTRVDSDMESGTCIIVRSQHLRVDAKPLSRTSCDTGVRAMLLMSQLGGDIESEEQSIWAPFAFDTQLRYTKR